MENEELIKAAEHHNKITIPSDYHSFINGANWQAKRMYSEEEVIDILYRSTTARYNTITEWFNENEKK